jgi:hypothetical protein
MNVSTHCVYRLGFLLLLVDSSRSHGQLPDKPYGLQLQTSLALTIQPSQSVPSGYPSLDSSRRRLDSALTVDFRRAFPARVELLRSGGVRSLDTTALLWRPEARIKTPSWRRSAIGDSLVLSFGGWPLFGQVTLVEQPSRIAGDAELRSGIGLWGHRSVMVQRVSCTALSDSSRRPPNER